MNDFQMSEFQPYLFLLIGLIIIAFAIFKTSTSGKIIKNGLKAEGIIFALDYKRRNYPGSSDMDYNNVFDTVTVRFVTRKMEWITAELNDDFAVYYTGQYKVGDKIDIMYNESNPNEFIVLTKQSEVIARMIGLFLGLALALYGTYEIVKSYHSDL